MSDPREREDKSKCRALWLVGQRDVERTPETTVGDVKPACQVSDAHADSCTRARDARVQGPRRRFWR